MSEHKVLTTLLKLSQIIASTLMAGAPKDRIGHTKLQHNKTDATANIIITEKEVLVKFQKRAHNPLLIAAGLDETDIKVPWIERKRLRYMLG